MTNNITLASVFIIGILHVLEHEGEAVASLCAAMIGSKIRKILFLVFLYGLGMMIADTALGFIFGYIGAQYLAKFSKQLEIIAASFTVAFGFFVFRHNHESKSGRYMKGLRNVRNGLAVFVFGIVHGLPPCPIEIGILIMAASTRSTFYGGLLVAAYSFGTFISLLPFGLAVGGILALTKKRYGKKVEEFIPKLSGIAISLIGLFMLTKSLLSKG